MSRLSSETFNKFFELSIDGIFVSDEKGRFVEVNEAYCQLSGYSRQELLSMSIQEVEAQETAEETREHIQNVLELGKQRFLTQQKKKSGQIIDVDITTTVVRDDPENYLVTFVRDVTASKLVEESLKESRERFKALSESTFEGIAIHEKGVILETNSAFLKKFGYSKEEAEGRDISSLMAREVHKQIKRVVEPSLGGSVEITARRKDESLFPAEVRSRAIGFRGKTAGVISFRDITDRKHNEDMLRKSHERFNTVLDSLDSYVYVAEIETGEILFANLSLRDALGTGWKDVIGSKAGETLTCLFGDGMQFLEREHLLLKSGEPGPPISWEFKSTLNEKWFFARDRAIRWVDGRIVRLEIVTDITDQKEAEKREKFHELQLIKADRLKSLGILAAGMAHEVNNPNNFILLNAPMVARAWKGAQRVLDRKFDEDGDFLLETVNYSGIKDTIPKLIDDIESGSKRIQAIVDKLGDYARGSVGETAGEIDVNRAVDNAANLVSYQIDRYTRRFKVVKEEGVPVVNGNQYEFEQVLINIMNNALQSLPAMERGVTVSAGLDGNHVYVKVEDQGIGMPKEDLEHVFDPFFTTKRTKGGAGLGLSVSYGIIERLGGTMSFDSTINVGTTVIVKLPVREKK